MKSIEEKAVQTYNENLLFLQTKHHKVFEKIMLLEQAIQNVQYKERYALEYIDNAFNVLNLRTNTFLYEEGSLKHAQKAVKNVNFSKTDNVFEGYKHYDIPENLKEDLDNLETRENFLIATAKLIDYSNKFANPASSHLKKIYKFIFMGTGLGVHITEIDKKIKSKLYCIVEDDLELFKLSLFVTNYALLEKNGTVLLFCIFDEEKEFQKKIQEFLAENFMYNQYIKFCLLFETDASALKILHESIITQEHFNFNFSYVTKNILRPLEYLQKSYKIANFNALMKCKNISEKPLLLLGAGPSFEKNIDWVQKHQNKFIIVAVSTILSDLEKYAIKPDIITHIHGDDLALAHVKKVKNISFFDRAISMFAAMSFPEFTQFFLQENVFIFENSSTYKDGFGKLSGFTNVGSYAFSLLLQLQTKELYLLGLDFALDQKSGKTHSSTHEYIKKAELQEKKKLDGALDYEMGVVKIAGNFEEEVFSTVLYKNQVQEMQKIYESYPRNKERNIYNLSDGAKIESLQAKRVEDIDILKFKEINKEIFYKEFKSFLETDSQNILNATELHKISLMIEDATKRLYILERYSKQKTGDINSYHHNILKMFQSLLFFEVTKIGAELSNILSSYFQFVSGYIFDIINTKEIKNQKKMMKDLEKLFVPQVKKIIENYQKALQEYLDFASIQE